MKSSYFFSIGIVLLCLLVLDYSSAWTAPSGNPPASNVAAPINTSGTAQVKNGALSVDGLAVFGNGLLENGGPRLEFSDTNHTDWWIHVNNDRIYFINDRDDNGSWSGESPWPLLLDAPGRFADFDGKVRADEYCNGNGSICISGNDIGGTSASPFAPVYFGDAGRVDISTITSVNAQSRGNRWVRVNYPAAIPSSATAVIVEAKVRVEDDKGITIWAQADNLDRMTLVSADSTGPGDSAQDTTYVTLPYNPSRTIDIRMNEGSGTTIGNGFSGNQSENVRASFVGYVEG